MKIEVDANIKHHDKELNINSDMEEGRDMAVMSKPSNKPFVVSKEDMQKFKDEKTSKKIWNEIMQIAKDFHKNFRNGDDE